MLNRTLYTFLLSLILVSAKAQKLPIGIRLNMGIGGTFNDAATQQFFNHSISVSSSSFLNYKGVFAGAFFYTPLSSLRKELELNEITHSATEELGIDIRSWVLGYSIRFANQNISVDSYLGGMKTYIENHNGKNNYASTFGSCGGFYIYKYSEPTLKAGNFAGQWFMFLHNRLAFPQLSKLNAQMGSVQYTIEIGFGIHWGNIKDYWQRRY